MGLDISFSTKQALKAGAEISLSSDEVTDAMDKDFEYLMKIQHNWNSCNNDHHFVQVDICTDSMSVRANKWGNTYKPLTAWLKYHDIEFTEF